MCLTNIGGESKKASTTQKWGRGQDEHDSCNNHQYHELHISLYWFREKHKKAQATGWWNCRVRGSSGHSDLAISSFGRQLPRLSLPSLTTPPARPPPSRPSEPTVWATWPLSVVANIETTFDPARPAHDMGVIRGQSRLCRPGQRLVVQT